MLVQPKMLSYLKKMFNFELTVQIELPMKYMVKPLKTHPIREKTHLEI